MTDEHRLEMLERQISDLYRKVEPVNVVVERLDAVRADIQEMRDENADQHGKVEKALKNHEDKVDSRISGIEGKLVAGAMAMATTFAAALVAVIARGGI